MKPAHLLAAIVAATLPFAIVSAEDAAKPDAADQKNEQNSNQMGMMDMNKGQMMSNWAKPEGASPECIQWKGAKNRQGYPTRRLGKVGSPPVLLLG